MEIVCKIRISKAEDKRTLRKVVVGMRKGGSEEKSKEKFLVGQTTGMGLDQDPPGVWPLIPIPTTDLYRKTGLH